LTGVRALTGQDIGEAAEAVPALLDNVAAGAGRTASEFVALRVLHLGAGTGASIPG